MRTVRVLREAAEEVVAAATHDELERPGLGRQYQAAVHDALLVLAEDVVPPATSSRTLTKRGVRRLVMRRFPYSLVVRERQRGLEVVAFAHHARRPGYWTERLRT